MSPKNPDADRLVADQQIDQLIAIAGLAPAARTRAEQRILDSYGRLSDDDIIGHFIRRVLPDLRIRLARTGHHQADAQCPLRAAYEALDAERRGIITVEKAPMSMTTAKTVQPPGDALANEQLREALRKAKLEAELAAKDEVKPDISTDAGTDAGTSKVEDDLPTHPNL
jgi:hypothetical protein